MRKMLSFGIAAALTAVAITAWATAVTRTAENPEISTAGIDTFMQMTTSTNLQVQQYDAF